MSSSYTFNWPSGPDDVIVTGTFDEWSKSLPLVKQTDGSFELTVPFGKDTHVLYKYVVDGEWLVNPAQSITSDSNGIENNVLTSDHLFTSEAASKIPEAGGLAVMPGSLKTTVLPSSEGQQATLGEPGIFIPKDKDSLAAFTTYENTNRDLNSEAPVLTPEEKKKQKKKLKRTKYKLNKKAKAAQAGAASSTPESSPEPETNSAEKAAIAAVGVSAIDAHDENVTAAGPAREAYGSGDNHVSHVVTSASEAERSSGVPTRSDLDEAARQPVASATVVEERIIETYVPSEEPAPKAGKVLAEDEKEPAPYSLVEKDLAQPFVAPTGGKSLKDVNTSLDADKEPAPYSLTEKDLAASTVVIPPALGTAQSKTPVESEKEPAPYSLSEKDLAQPVIATGSTKNPSSGERADKEPAPYALAQEDIAASTVVVPTEIKKPAEADKEPAPYSLTENDLAQSTVVTADQKALGVKKEESRGTLDPTVVGVVGAAAGAGSADVVAAEISHSKNVDPTIQPAISEPIENNKNLSASVVAAPAGPTSPVQLAPFSNIEDVPIVPVSAKEVTALPVNGGRLESDEEIIITQGGHDIKEIEQQIVAAEDGPVSVEELQPTVSEAKQLAEEAHIPSDEIKAAPVPVKQKNAPSSSGKGSKADGKEKKKKGFFSKIKKIFK